MLPLKFNLFNFVLSAVQRLGPFFYMYCYIEIISDYVQ